MAFETVQVVAVGSGGVELPWWGVLLTLLGLCGSFIVALVKTVRASDLKSVDDKFEDLEGAECERHTAVLAALDEVKGSVAAVDRKVEAHQQQNAEEFRRLHKADADLRVELADRVGRVEHELGLRREKGGGG